MKLNAITVLASLIIFLSGHAFAQNQLPESIRQGSTETAIQALASHTGEPAEKIRAIQKFRAEIRTFRASKDELLTIKRQKILALHKKIPSLTAEQDKDLILMCLDWGHLTNITSDIWPWVKMYPLYESCLTDSPTKVYLMEVAIARKVVAEIRALDKKTWTTSGIKERIDDIRGAIMLADRNNSAILEQIIAKEKSDALSPSEKAAVRQEQREAEARRLLSVCEILRSTVAGALNKGNYAEAEKIGYTMVLNNCP